MEIENLIIEVTRKCNLKCSHCLRGSVQNTNIDNKYITMLLKQVTAIRTITFTGGEPSLNIEAIKHFVKEVKRLKIDVSDFYIATNGKRITQDFAIACLELYAICDEKEYCTLDLSNDIYHYEAMYREVNDDLLKGLSFYKNKFLHNRQRYELLNEGRAKQNNMGRIDIGKQFVDDKEEFRDAEIYLNVNGDIVNGCNWSYVSQKKHILCNVKDLKNFYNNLED